MSVVELSLLSIAPCTYIQIKERTKNINVATAIQGLSSNCYYAL